MSAKAQWSSAVLPAVLVADAVGNELAADLRARIAGRGYTRFALLDRASYEAVEDLDEPGVFEALVGIAEEITQCSLEVVAAKALRMRAGDYVLVRHDRVYDDRPIELVVDLSPHATAGAEVHYRHRGQVFFAVPSRPGILSLVERGPTVMANHTYVSKRYADAEIVRLVMLLRRA